MGHLPKARLEAYHPPSHGVDLFGPLTVKWDHGTAKRWGCLFICLTAPAVCFEVTPSLETDYFIMVRCQFISRRGPLKEIRCDRLTNFVGANRELKEAITCWDEWKIERQLQQKGTKGVFQPAAASHMSGVCERIELITKKHLKSAVRYALLTDDELRAHLEFKVSHCSFFSGPYKTFSFGGLANFPDSNRCEIYTRYWNWIEV